MSHPFPHVTGKTGTLTHFHAEAPLLSHAKNKGDPPTHKAFHESMEISWFTLVGFN